MADEEGAQGAGEGVEEDVACGRVGAEEEVLAVVGEGERGPVLRVSLLEERRGLRGDVRRRVELGEVEGREGRFVEIAQVVH